MKTTFSGMSIQASGASKAKRGLGSVTFSPDPVNFSTELVLNETVLFSDDSFTATLESGDLSLSVTVGGSLTYNVITSTLGKPVSPCSAASPNDCSAELNACINECRI